jgi:hypothetical protein
MLRDISLTPATNWDSTSIYNKNLDINNSSSRSRRYAKVCMPAESGRIDSIQAGIEGVTLQRTDRSDSNSCHQNKAIQVVHSGSNPSFPDPKPAPKISRTTSFPKKEPVWTERRGSVLANVELIFHFSHRRASLSARCARMDMSLPDTTLLI